MMNVERKSRDFVEFLKEIAANGYYFPTEEIMRGVHQIVSMWAPELVITRRHFRAFWRKEIFLVPYEGGAETFRGLWHIPGGYNKWQEPDIQATCSTVAKRELGIDVEYIKTIDAYKWTTEEHPYGHPLSLYVLCRPKENTIPPKGKFFSKRNLPRNLVEPHRRFIEKYL